MIPVITPEESARLDAAATDPVEVLMDRAGHGVALVAAGLGVGYGHRVVVLAGPGNNGGDGYVAARYLRGRGVHVEVHALTDPKTDAAADARARAVAAGVRVRPMDELRPADLVIDAVFGGGFRRGIPDALVPWLDADPPVLAVDVPSGLDPATGWVADRAFTALSTVTFHALKTGHVLGDGPDRCGPVTVVDIGLEDGEPAMRLAEDHDAVRPGRERTAHKWSAGSVLVVGGAPGMVGAAVLAGRSALHFGAGSVGVAVPAENRSVVSGLAPELLSYELSSVAETASRFDVLVVGPGLGPGRGDLVRRLLRQHDGPVLLDADGLTSVDPGTLGPRGGPTVVTPHAGEFGRVFEVDPVPDEARRLAGELGICVLLKGNPTFVTDGGAPWVVVSNGPELATIGTGDVLAGMAGALLARGLDPETAAMSAAHWHGVTGAELAHSGTVTSDRLALAVGRHAWEEHP